MNAQMAIEWLRATAKRLDDPETRDEEIQHIANFPWTFHNNLNDVADVLENNK